MTLSATNTAPPRRLTVAGRLGLILEILAVYANARWLLWRRDFREAVETLRDRQARGHASVDTSRDLLLEARRLAKAVRLTLDHIPFDSRCLARSLVLSCLLARRGIESSVVIGVNPKPSFKAHAWVESGRYRLLPSFEPEYERLVEV